MVACARGSIFEVVICLECVDGTAGMRSLSTGFGMLSFSLRFPPSHTPRKGRTRRWTCRRCWTAELSTSLYGLYLQWEVSLHRRFDRGSPTFGLMDPPRTEIAGWLCTTSDSCWWQRASFTQGPAVEQQGRVCEWSSAP